MTKFIYDGDFVFAMDYILVLRICSIIGLIISLYFLGIYRGWIKADNRLVPQWICSEKTCHSILKTKFANVFDVPNFILGIYYYIAISASTFFKLSFNIFYIFLVVSWLVMIFSLYPVYVLSFRLKTNCTLCFASHVLNIIIAIVFFLQSPNY